MQRISIALSALISREQ